MEEMRLTVRSMRAQNSGEEIALQVVLESGEHSETRTLTIMAEQYVELKPRKGEISEDFFDKLQAASDLCGAIRAGENFLSYGSNSVETLARKISQKGFSREVSRKAAEKLSQMGLINEREDVKREVEKCLRKLWGEKRIRTHLWTKGFGREALDTLPDLLCRVDFAEQCAKLIQKHYGEVPKEPEEARRMTAALSRYGYSLEEIRAAKRKWQ